MPITDINGVEIAYETYGDAKHPAVLLLMGLGSQLTMWPDKFVEDLVAAGHYVIATDNRDIGLSAKHDASELPNPYVQAALRRIGIKLKSPYTLREMADDAVGVLDALGIGQAHVIGISMGGMIAQHVAALHPKHTASLTAIMTTTGNPKVPRPRREVVKALARDRTIALTPEKLLEDTLAFFKLVGTPGEDHATNGMGARLKRSFDRSFQPSGVSVQLSAIIASGDFRSVTKKIKAPTLVIHGSVDPLVSPEGGKDVALNVRGAKLEMIEGMGHDIPPKFLPDVTGLILGHMREAVKLETA